MGGYRCPVSFIMTTFIMTTFSLVSSFFFLLVSGYLVSEFLPLCSLLQSLESVRLTARRTLPTRFSTNLSKLDSWGQYEH